jgi:hypothetical protein
MAEATEKVELRLDRPLRPGTALEADALDRKLFDEHVVEVLDRVTPDAALDASVEVALLKEVEAFMRAKLEREPVAL